MFKSAGTGVPQNIFRLFEKSYNLKLTLSCRIIFLVRMYNEQGIDEENRFNPKYDWTFTAGESWKS